MAVIRRKGKVKPISNLLLDQASGMLGGIVIKRYKDKIVLSMPSTKGKKKPTPLQKNRRQIMKEAVQFARRVIADPVHKAAWKKHTKGYTNVYQAAVAWYLNHRNDHQAIPPHSVKSRGLATHYKRTN